MTRRDVTPFKAGLMVVTTVFVFCFFVFGKVMTSSGLIRPEYKGMLLPGIIAIAMLLSGVWSVAMPLVSEFQFTKEIEDRLLAPISIATARPNICG